MWENSLPQGFDINDFKINDVQKAQLQKEIDGLKADAEEDAREGIETCSADDAKDLEKLLQLFIEGKSAEAVVFYGRLDTACRECTPQWVAEVAECGINPTWWKIEESYEVTAGLVGDEFAAPAGDTNALKAKVLDQIWYWFYKERGLIKLTPEIFQRMRVIYKDNHGGI